MEKIEKYNYPNIFSSMDYFEHIVKLNAKIQKDKAILKQNNTPENNKIFIENLIIYHSLIVDEVLINSHIAKDSLKEQKDGWFIWMKIEGFSTTYDYKTTDELYTYWFDKYFDRYFPNKQDEPYFNEVVQNYKNGCYYSCACCLFPLMERIQRRISKFNGNTIFSVKNELSKSHLPDPQKCNDYLSKFEKSLNTFLDKNTYKKSVESDVEPKEICRNRVMHGIFTREISKTDCLKLFCIYESLYKFNYWLNSVNSIKVLIEQLHNVEN